MRVQVPHLKLKGYS